MRRHRLSSIVVLHGQYEVRCFCGMCMSGPGTEQDGLAALNRHIAAYERVSA